MAETPISQQELFERILYGSLGVKENEAAIQSALKAFTEATSAQVSTLVKSNSLYPEMREGMLKLESSVMDMTLEAIKSIQAQIPSVPKPDSKT